MKIESDAMWRIYAPNKNGVKIQTTIKKLYHSLHSQTSEYRTISCFIGKVDYQPKQELTALAQEMRKNGTHSGNSRYQAESLLIKRFAFEHEKEVRLIYLEPHNQAYEDVYSYDFDPHQYIETITFDPRMNKSLYRIYKEHLQNIGFKGKIIQSGLYGEMKP